jgi:5'-methylthioinosine phosphorylase
MKLAIIGGSLLKEINDFSVVKQQLIETPFGKPSDRVVSGEINGAEVVYLNRHGAFHHIAPHQINYRANMFVLKSLDVTHVVAVTAVGGISDQMSPMKWVVPDQIIDYSHGREKTYNDENDEAVHHIDFSYPFDEVLGDLLQQSLLKESCEFELEATYGVTQGPRLETVAEIKRMKNDGCDIVGMTAMPEACLARELEMKYSTLSLVVNWAAGAGIQSRKEAQQRAEIISMHDITERIQQGNIMAEKIIKNMITLSAD